MVYGVIFGNERSYLQNQGKPEKSLLAKRKMIFMIEKDNKYLKN